MTEISDDVEVLKDTALVNYSENTNSSMQKMTLAEIEKKVILETLNELSGNKRKTAQILNIAERALHRKLKEYGMENN